MLDPQTESLINRLKQTFPDLLNNSKFDELVAAAANESDYDPSTEILSGWCAADIYDAVKQMTNGEQSVSYEDALKVLHLAADRVDYNYGVSWEFLQDQLKELQESGQVTLIANPDDDQEDYA